ncbi:MAG: biotin--[acetyl-CoA-carboxylase] ligase [Sedimentibacter sp.]|uniref:biotin--[acetyl-CoA-carboxylase] ligase n=1 Tax=Sedimentibacter sp. TaxID=1960295 RepID=UPI003158B4DB
MYDLNSISGCLNTKIIGQTVIQYDNLTSTYAKAKNICGTCPDGTVVLSENQSKCTLRFGNRWICSEDKNIYMSIILKPSVNNLITSKFDLVGCSSVCEGIYEACGLECKIKWPNDIVVNDRKLASINCEFIGKSSEPSGIIVSVCINANMEEEETEKIYEEIKKPATSIKLAAGEAVDREALIAGILNSMEKHYEEFLTKSTVSNAVLFCIMKSALLNRRIKAAKRGKKTLRSLLVKTVDHDGCLVVTDEKGNEEILGSGETIIIYEGNS